MVDTYAVPAYGEANPAVITCVSFPFLFGVMFGDVGHGALLLFAGILACVFVDKLRPHEELEYLVYGRYMLLLMGFWATYMGLLYNDFMSIPL